MVKKHRASKRIPLKMKYKIEKNVSAVVLRGRLPTGHSAGALFPPRMLPRAAPPQVKNQERKERKEGRKGILKGRKKLSKDPGIPNLHPFKTQLMAQVCGVGRHPRPLSARHPPPPFPTLLRSLAPR